jgi:signal transduction histidine kinase
VISIKWKLALVFAALAALTSLTVGALSYSFLRERVEAQTRDFLEQSAREIVDHLTPSFRRADLEQVGRLSWLWGRINGIEVRVLDDSRAVLFDSMDGADSFPRGDVGEILERMLPMSPGNRILDRGAAPPKRGTGSGGDTVALPIRQAGRTVGFVEIASPDFGLGTLRAARNAIALAVTGVTILAAVLGYFLSRGFTRPVVELERVAERIGNGDLTSRIQSRGSDEIGRLGNRFNLMADTLADTIRTLERERDTLKRFAQDASHELRTPLTALRTFLEILSGPSGGDKAKREEFLKDGTTQLDRIDWIVANLLDLSRYDAELIPLDTRTYSIAGLVEETYTAYRGEAESRGVTLVVDPDTPDLTAEIDGPRIVTALGNLVSNAVKFTAPGSEVVIGYGPAEGDRIRLSVDDRGPGIREEERELVFQRFYRSDMAGDEGTGLGLALAKSVVEAHGGTIEVESREDGGARFVITLPRTRT